MSSPEEVDGTSRDGTNQGVDVCAGGNLGIQLGLNVGGNAIHVVQFRSRSGHTIKQFSSAVVAVMPSSTFNSVAVAVTLRSASEVGCLNSSFKCLQCVLDAVVISNGGTREGTQIRLPSAIPVRVCRLVMSAVAADRLVAEPAFSTAVSKLAVQP